MKKAIIFIIVLLFLFSSVLCAGASEVSKAPDKTELSERFDRWANDSFYSGALQEDNYRKYFEMKELYRHTENNSSTDWILLEATSQPFIDWLYTIRFGGRIIGNNNEMPVFKTGYGIYDVEQDTFFDLKDLCDKAELYPDLESVLDQLRIGRPIGDADMDNTITILDATIIQRCLADLEPSWVKTQYFTLTAEFSHNGTPKYYYLDKDEDGEVTILDATAIQRQLAGTT